MDTRKTRDLPARLEAVRRRFERWRRTRRPPSRIPDPLWVVAVKLVGRYGIHRTARALRVDYYSLKKRVTAASAAHHSRPTPTTALRRCPVGARAVPAAKNTGRLIQTAIASGIHRRAPIVLPTGR